MTLTTLSARSKLAMLGLLLALALLLLLPYHPNNYLIPNRDAGVFLYIGSQWLDGKLPYKELWDHKPPGIFVINIVGLAFTSSNRLGIWLLEVLSLWIAVTLSYILLLRNLNVASAWFGTFIWLSGLISTIDGGNLPEEWVLPLQFLSILLFIELEKNSAFRPLGWMLLGVAGGISFLIRQNLIGVWLSIGLFIVWQAYRNEARRKQLAKLGIMLLGAIIPLITVILYFELNDALFFFWDSAFQYNFVYSTTTLLDRFRSVQQGFIVLPLPLTLITTGVWFTPIFSSLLNVGPANNLNFEQQRLLHVIVLILPIEMALSSLSGRGYTHYFMTWLPSIGLLSAFLLVYLQRGKLRLGSKLRLTSQVIIGIVIIIMVPNWAHSIRLLVVGHSNTPDSTLEEVTAYLTNHSTEKDVVLIWGAETFYHFSSRRESPSRFMYQYPLFDEAYAAQGLVSEFANSVQESPPEIIIDTAITNPNIISLEELETVSEWQEFYHFFLDNYQLEQTLGDSNWPAYRLVTEPPPP